MVKDVEARLSPKASLSLTNELRTAVGLLKYGLGSLQAIDMANDFYHLPLLLLASGLERLCKCVLLLQYHTSHGCFPPRNWLKDRGHNLTRLIDEIARKCCPEEVPHCRALGQDQEFITSDPIVTRLIQILAQFGSGGRYHDLDTVCGERQEGPSPEQEWQELEMAIVRNDPALNAKLEELQSGNIQGIRSLYPEINSRLQATLERLIRALCRLLTLNPMLRDQGRKFSPQLCDFLFLCDDELGSKNYADPSR